MRRSARNSLFTHDQCCSLFCLCCCCSCCSFATRCTSRALVFFASSDPAGLCCYTSWRSFYVIVRSITAQRSKHHSNLYWTPALSHCFLASFQVPQWWTARLSQHESAARHSADPAASVPLQVTSAQAGGDRRNDPDQREQSNGQSGQDSQRPQRAQN